MTRATFDPARDTILARIREALRLPAPPPHTSPSTSVPAADGGLPILPLDIARPWLPDGGRTAAEQLEILGRNLAALRAEVHRAADLEAAGNLVAGLAGDRGWRRVAWHADPVVQRVVERLACDAYRVDAGDFDKGTLEECDAGITACEALVAQTGSILVSSRTCGGRALSILPHAHVVVALHDQIVPTLGDALRIARDRSADRMPGMLSFITGPSRTGDIERILVLGAHGPKQLVVVLVDRAE